MAPAASLATAGRPLLGSFEESVLNRRLKPISVVGGYLVEIRANSARSSSQPPLSSQTQISFFSAGQSFPYLGQIDLGLRGYRIPKKGTLQVTLFNPLGTVVNLFILPYDFADMPAESQTFLRQKTVFQASSATRPTDGQVRYLIQLNVVSSKTGRIYLNKDLRIYVSKKVDQETAAQLLEPQDYRLASYYEMPANPRYFSR